MRTLVIALILAFATVAPSARAQSDQDKTQSVVDLINRARVDAGLLPLARSSELDTAAQSHSADMVQHNYLDHTGSDGSEPQDRADRAGYHVPPNSAWIVVEVISAISADPSGPVNWWLGDAQHRNVLLSPRYREIGVGYAQGGDYGNYWTADVGCRPGVLPTVQFAGQTYTHIEECGEPSVGAALAATPTPTSVPTVVPPTLTPVPVAAPPTVSLQALPSTITRGGVVNIQWQHLDRPSTTDWVGLYRPGDADTAQLSWVYVGCGQQPMDARALGSCNMLLPTVLSPGTYEFRIFAANSYVRLSVSPPVSVS